MGAVTQVWRKWRRAAEEAGSQPEGSGRGRVEERAGCAFGLVTRRGLEDLEGSFRRLEAKIDGLLFAVAAGVLLELWRALTT